MFPFYCIQDLHFGRNITEVMLCAMFFSVNHIQRPLTGDISCPVSPDGMIAYILWEITIALNIILLRFTHNNTCHFSLSLPHTHIFLFSFSLSFSSHILTQNQFGSIQLLVEVYTFCYSITTD